MTHTPWIPDHFVVPTEQRFRTSLPMRWLDPKDLRYLAVTVAFWAIHRAKLRSQQ